MPYTADINFGALQVLPKDDLQCIELPISKKIQITHDTYIFRFAFPKPEMEFGLPCGGHVVFHANMETKAKPEGEIVTRKYTPTSRVHEKGQVDFVIKIYFANVHPNFPDGGLMTQYLHKLKEGDRVRMSGPNGKLSYFGHGNFTIRK